jgi:amidase
VKVADYAGCDATELTALLRCGQVALGEVREAALRAIEQVDPRLNAIVHGPLEDASASDGPPPVFHLRSTTPLSQAGRPCQVGSRLLEGFALPSDTNLARRFRDAR